MDNIETAATLPLRFVTVENSTTAQECLEKLLTEYTGPIIREITVTGTPIVGTAPVNVVP